MPNWLDRSFTALAAIAMTAGCGQQDTVQVADKAAAKNQLAAQAAARTACAANGKLPLSGLCREFAASLMQQPTGPATTPPEGCEWTPAEVAISPSQIVLYRAARCQSRSAKLAFVPGVPLASLTLAVSPYEAPAGPADVVVRLTKAEDRDAILKVSRAFVTDPRERARCQVRPAGIDEWPSDALVIDEVPPPPADGVRSACGELGLDEDAQTFWRISQGLGWFFQLGQDSPIVDPRSFTVIDRTAEGIWQRRQN